MFQTVTLDNWDQIHEYASRRGWLFRGESSTNWQPKTSLERCCDRLEIKASLRRAMEDRIIREFRRAYHQFARHVPHRRAIYEWLSIMQHHGAPTRLLDFTYSVYVAAYFAVEEAKKDSVVWAIDGPWALQRSQELLLSAGKHAGSMLDPIMDEDEEIGMSLLMSEPYVPAAWPVNPFRLNERLRVQQGVFLVQGDISRPFSKNLKALSDGRRSEHFERIVIPKEKRNNVLERLWTMDISRAALFPGLDGFARSLGIYHSLFNPAPWGQKSGSKRR
jgi:hypothetical protein